MSFSAISLGQINEIGFFIGGSNYIGDIGRTHYLYPNNQINLLFYLNILSKYQVKQKKLNGKKQFEKLIL